MRIADRVVLYRAQAKPLAGIVSGLLQPAIVEHQRFGLGVFQEQLAVISAGKAAPDFMAHGVAVEIGAVEKRGCGGHNGSRCKTCRPPRARGPITTGPGELSKDLRKGRLTTR